MLFTPFSDTEEFVTMSKVSGKWSAFPMYFSSKSCFFPLCNDEALEHNKLLFVISGKPLGSINP